MADTQSSGNASALPRINSPRTSRATGRTVTPSDMFAAFESMLEQHTRQPARTLPDLVDLYLLKLKGRGVGPDTKEKNQRELGRFVQFAERHHALTAREIDDVLVLRYADTWEKDYPSGVTRNLVRLRLVLFLKFCLHLDQMKRLPDVPRVKVRREPTLPLTQEQYERLLAAAKMGQRQVKCVPIPVRLAVVQLMRWSGAAVTDATMMRRDSIIYDESKRIFRCKFRRQKTGVLVNNPIPEAIALELAKASQLCTSKTYLFLDKQDEGQTNSAHRWSDWFRKTFERAGMPGGHSHQLRDTYAVGLLLKGVALENVSKALGHTSVKTTERYYAPWIKERQDLLDDTLIRATGGAE